MAKSPLDVIEFLVAVVGTAVTVVKATKDIKSK